MCADKPWLVQAINFQRSTACAAAGSQRVRQAAACNCSFSRSKQLCSVLLLALY
jgi:hypothetical protein